MRIHDLRGGGFTLVQRERQAVRTVQLDREDEHIGRGAVDENDLDRFVATETSRPQPVHSVDDPPCPTVYDNGWQNLVRFGEHSNVFGAFSGPYQFGRRQ